MLDTTRHLLLDPIVGSLSYFPSLLRPFLFAVCIGVLLWGMFARRWILVLMHWLRRAVLYLSAFAAAVILAGEFVHTRTRRARGKAPAPWVMATGEVLEGPLAALHGPSWPPEKSRGQSRPWPVKWLAALLAIGSLCWLIGGAMPVTAASSGFVGQGYAVYRQLEQKCGVPVSRLTRVAQAPLPTLAARNGGAVLNLGKSHSGATATLYVAPVDPDAGPIATVRLNHLGAARIPITRATRGHFARGRVLAVHYGPWEHLIRVV